MARQSRSKTGKPSRSTSVHPSSPSSNQGEELPPPSRVTRRGVPSTYILQHDGPTDVPAPERTETFAVFDCPACGQRLNSANPITDEMRRTLSQTVIRAMESKIIRLTVGAVLKCFKCKARSTIRDDGTWRIEKADA